MSPNLPLNTRERILAYLQENRASTVSGLSRLWGLTRADIRYHMTALVEEGLVELIPRDPNQAAQRGRPTQSYRLALHSTPDNLPALCAAALDMLLKTGAEESPQEEAKARETVLRGLASRLCGNPSRSSNITQRYTQAVAFLNQHAYRARWEAHANGPRILLRNCPYAAVLQEHPEMCMVDGYLLECLLQVPISQAVCMNIATGKPPACIFTGS